MSHKQVLQVGIAVVLVMLFLVGCGGSAPTAVSEAPAVTSAPEQAAATPTSEPPTSTPTPEPPTGTPTPTVFQPQSDAVLTGVIEVSEDVGGAIIIILKTSKDGTSITTAGMMLMGPSKCGENTMTEGVLSFSFKNGPFPIKEGNIDVLLGKTGELKGRFTSPTEVSGTIKDRDLGCKFGPLNWSAKAE